MSDHQLNILEIMGLKRSHYHRSLDSTSANDITITPVNAYQQYDVPTVNRVTKQFSSNIKRLAEYIKEKNSILHSVNLSNYITTDVEDADGMNKIFVSAPCTMSSQRILDLKNCRDIQGSLNDMPKMLAVYMMEDYGKTNNIIIGFTKDNRIVRYNLGLKNEETMHPTMQPLYEPDNEVELEKYPFDSKISTVFKRVGFADSNNLYMYVITNKDIRLFRTSDLCNLERGLIKNDIQFCNIIDFKNSYSDDHKRYNDNLFIEDILRNDKINDLINEGRFNEFVDKYFKLGDFPENVLEKDTYYSTNPIKVFDVGLVTGKYGLYQIHCFSSKPKNINEFEIDNDRGSLHIRCLDNKPIKDAFFYEDNGEKYLVAIHGWPKYDKEYSIALDNSYKGMSVFKLDFGACASTSIPVPIEYVNPNSLIAVPQKIYVAYKPFKYDGDTDYTHPERYYYTLSRENLDNVVKNGWEEITDNYSDWYAYSVNAKNTDPIYKYYNIQYGKYMFTTAKINKAGWDYCGLAFYAYITKSRIANVPENKRILVSSLKSYVGENEEFVSKERESFDISCYLPIESYSSKIDSRKLSPVFNYIQNSTEEKPVPSDGYVVSDTGERLNINQILDSRGINGAYVNNLSYCYCMYNKGTEGLYVRGFLIKYTLDNPIAALNQKSVEYWFVELADKSLCNVSKVFNKNEFNCLSEYKIKNAMYSNKTILMDIDNVGLVEGIQEHAVDNSTGFRFKVLKKSGTYDEIKFMFEMNRCFVALSDKSVYFIISNGTLNELKLGTDIYTSVKNIDYVSTYGSSNILCIGDNSGESETDISRFAILSMKYELDIDTYIELILQNISSLITSNFLTKDNIIAEKINKHIKELHSSDSIISKLNDTVALLKNGSIQQSTGFSDNLKVSYIILNYPNHGNDFSYIETNENSTDIYGRINSKTINANPLLMTQMNRNSNALTYYDTVLDENGKIILSTNKLVYSTCRLSDKMMKLTINVPSTGTYYVDNILGWSNGSRVGSSLSRKNMNDGYIPGLIEHCGTHYQLILNKVFFNIRNIINVTAQLASAPLNIYSNTNEFDIRHYGMYDCPAIAPLNMNSLTTNYTYDLSSISNDEVIFTFSVFGGDALTINILIENNEE